MSVIFIDQFIGTHLDVSEQVTVSFNTQTGAITSDSQSNRPTYDEYNPERTFGDSLGNVPSEDGTIRYFIEKDLSKPFARVSSTEPIEPTPPQCDLTIAAEPTKESSQGANNGSVSVTALSSFAGISVSLDGVNWVAVNGGVPYTYAPLNPGNYIAYAKDVNGCTANIPFGIESFTNPISGGFNGGLPQVEVSPGNVSRWSAAFNPVVLNFNNTPDPAKKNFRIEIEITSQQGIVTGSWSPDINGKTRCDISAFLQGLVNAKDDFKYDVLNYRDINRAASYTIRYREIWDGDNSVWYYAPQPLYVTFSAKQLGDKYGGNMAEYVPFLNEPNPDYKAKFLTLFEEPTAWSGLPYDNSFILSENIVNTPVKLRTMSLDINKKPYGGATFGYLLNNDAGYILGSDLGKLIIQQGSLPEVSNDGIFEQLGINRLMLAGAPGVGVEYFQIQLYTGADNAPNFITQPLIIKVEKPCIDPYIYIKWLNTLGGWDYWRFGYDQVTQLNTSDVLSVDRNVFDWSADDTIADTISKSGVNRISFGAVVPTNKVNGLTGLHTSVKIQMLVNLNPYKWHTVKLNTGSFDIKRAKTNFSELRFTLSLPEINIQSQ
jgi:hypothetical protein